MIKVDQKLLDLIEHRSTKIKVSLDSPPDGDEFRVGITTGGMDVVAYPAVLTFTPDDYDTPQTVQVAALPDSDMCGRGLTIRIEDENGENTVKVRAIVTAIDAQDIVGDFEA